jgi:ParB family chromosome partitioning protein
MEEAAKQIAAEQSFRQSGDEEPISGPQVVVRLLKAVSGRPGRPQKAVIEAAGSSIGVIEKDRARGLTITLNPTELSTEEILDALRPLIEKAKILKRPTL